MLYRFDIFLNFTTGGQKFVTAPGTPQAEIHTDTQHLKGFSTARMIFFHFQRITDLNIHKSPSLKMVIYMAL